MRTAALAGVIAAFVANAAYAETAGKPKTAEEMCRGLNAFSDYYRQNLDDATLEWLLCRNLIAIGPGLAKGERFPECNKLRLALLQEVESRGLDRAAMAQACLKEANSPPKDRSVLSREDYLALVQRLTRSFHRKDVLRQTRSLAERGDAKAQYNLGLAYAKAEGVPQDFVEAVRWYRRAAEQGLAEAQYVLGGLYRAKGEAQNYVQAYKWFTIAASQTSDATLRSKALEARDRVAAKMTPGQRAAAKMLARQWKPK